MNSLSTVEAELPPGFRFHPRDEELIYDYLMKWVSGWKYQSPLLIEVDLNKCEPWDIPEAACVGGKEWYFYSKRDRKYASGLRKNRATISGYWKATGKDRSIIRKGIQVGMRKTLVFYQGRAPKGQKTEWVMHEFRLEGPGAKTIVKEDWVLCRVICKNISELLKCKQETSVDTFSQSLSPLMEPHLVFDPNQYQASSHDHHYHEQVPCFSNIFNQTQIFPAFMDHPEIFDTKLMQNNFGRLLPEYNLQSMDEQSSTDKKVIRTVLGKFTKSGNTDILNYSMNGSPSFGEGSSESYLSETELSSLWNI